MTSDHPVRLPERAVRVPPPVRAVPVREHRVREHPAPVHRVPVVPAEPGRLPA